VQKARFVQGRGKVSLLSLELPGDQSAPHPGGFGALFTPSYSYSLSGKARVWYGNFRLAVPVPPIGGGLRGAGPNQLVNEGGKSSPQKKAERTHSLEFNRG